MKKVLTCLVVLIIGLVSFWTWATKAESPDAIDPNEVYIFTQKTCPHCWAAEDYLKTKYPSVNFKFRDLSDDNNRALFFACGEKFGLSKFSMGTPMFCMGTRYIMGWGSEEQEKFDLYIKDFLPQQSKP